MILNLGCGSQSFGDIKVDLYKTEITDLLCDGHFLPFRDNIFHLVYSRYVLEHLKNPMQSLREQKRILKGHGRIVLITDNASYWRFHLKTKSSHIGYKNIRCRHDKHYGLFIPIHLRNFFSNLNMDVDEIKFLSYDRKQYRRPTGLLNLFLRSIPFLRHIGFECIMVKSSEKNRGSWQNAGIRKGN